MDGLKSFDELAVRLGILRLNVRIHLDGSEQRNAWVVIKGKRFQTKLEKRRGTTPKHPFVSPKVKNNTKPITVKIHT